MKNLALLFLLALIAFVGCMDNNSILEPINETSEIKQLQKGRPILGLDFDYLLYDSLGTISSDDISQFGNELKKADDDLIKLDDYSDEDNYRVNYSRSFTVDGSKGARLAVKHRWWHEDGEMIWLEAELRIPRDAFEGELTFDMVFDVNNYSMGLYPSPYTFNKPVEFSMYWYGLDLDKFKGYELDFNYLDGDDEEIEYFRKSIDIENGSLVVWGAQLYHFSRYGWVRTSN